MRSFSPRLAWCLSRSGEPDTTTAGSLQAHSRTQRIRMTLLSCRICGYELHGKEYRAFLNAANGTIEG